METQKLSAKLREALREINTVMFRWDADKQKAFFTAKYSEGTETSPDDILGNTYGKGKMLEALNAFIEEGILNTTQDFVFMFNPTTRIFS